MQSICLETLVSEITCYMSSGTLDSACSLAMYGYVQLLHAVGSDKCMVHWCRVWSGVLLCATEMSITELVFVCATVQSVVSNCD